MESVRKIAFSFGFFHTPNPGFWVVTESENENSELRSYDSAEYESEEIGSEEAEEDVESEEGEYGEEEGDEIEESDNDIEVMEILAEAQKQSQIEKRPEQTNLDRNEKIESGTMNNSSTVVNMNVIDRTETKVCVFVWSKYELRHLLRAFIILLHPG